MNKKNMNEKKMLCTLGHQDIPVIQRQPEFIVDLLQTNILIFGAPMSGKTNLINLLITILHKKYTIDDEQIFILDFGGSLMKMEDMPLVAAYFDNSNEEYVKRVFNLVDNQLKKNISVLKAENYISYDNPLIHTTLFIDNVNAFIEEPRYSSYHEKLAKLCRDGLSKGITVVMTASSTKGLNSYLNSNSFEQKIALEMPTDSCYDIFNSKVIPVGNNPGHGYANITVKSDTDNTEDSIATFPMQIPYELQINLSDNIQDTQFQNNLMRKFHGQTVKKYRRFPDVLTENEYHKFLSFLDDAYQPQPDTNSCVRIGLDYKECLPYNINFEQTHVFAIYGKKEYGKTNLLNRIIKHIASDKNSPYRFVLFDDGRKQLFKLHEMLSSKSIYINGYENAEMNFNVIDKMKTVVKTKNEKLSPIKSFIKLIHEQFMSLENIRENKDMELLEKIFGRYVIMPSSFDDSQNNHYVFVLQSKFLYIQSPASEAFISHIFSSMAAMAKEKDWIFIFSDVKQINESMMKENFNSSIETAFLLDNIAEFVSERGQKSVFGNMDFKFLKEEYALCEKGDGYVYDIEEDNLRKLKFIKEKWGASNE